MTDLLRAHDAALERLRALHPKLIDLSLGRMQRLLADLGNPEQRLPPVIHVAGTNGKGSTVAFLRAIAEAAGLRVHVFTSPHLVRFAERIRLAGRLISDEQLADVLERVERLNAGQPITFFEVTTAAALLAFVEVPADLCLLEVGLGGRYDATNVVDRPAAAVIAPVDYDHKEFLGERIEQVAGEKAGILKRGAPGIVARQRPQALEVIGREAERVGAELVEAGRDFDAWAERGGMAFQDGEGLLDLPPPSLPGPHQIDNAALAIATVRTLKSLRIDDTAIAQGVRSAVWPARMQRLTSGPFAAMAEKRGADLWLDGGHNPHAARALAQVLAALQARDGRPVSIVAGMLGRKDVAGFFEALRELRPSIFTVGFEAEQAASPEELAQAARAAGLQAEASGDVEDGLRTALSSEGPPPHIVICGSLYLAGEVLAEAPETWPT